MFFYYAKAILPELMSENDWLSNFESRRNQNNYVICDNMLKRKIVILELHVKRA